MKNFNFNVLCLSIFSTFIISNCYAQKTALFNGHDLSGWYSDIPAHDLNPDTTASFIVKDGLLISMGEPRGHLITEKRFRNYRLEVKYRFTGEPGNCGVLIHASTPRALYKMFPKSIEVQLMNEQAGDFWCIVEDIEVPNMYERRGPRHDWGITEGRRRRILNLTDGSENPPGEWNEMTIEAVNDRIRVWVNGDLVNDGSNCTATEGQIAIQAEGAVVAFEYIRLEPITQLSD